MNDEELLRCFETQTLGHPEWNHRAHIRVAYLYLRRFGSGALERLRFGIQALNAAHGVLDTPSRGYHETLTQAWLRLVAGAITAHGPAEDSLVFIESNPQLLNKYLLRTFYTQARMTEARAKREFVGPDILPLPPSPFRGDVAHASAAIH